MIELGKKQTLVVVREKDFGIYLAEKQGDGIGASAQKAGACGNQDW